MSIQIRPAQPSDAPQILAFITELADYEKARHEVIASVADIQRSLFSEGSTAHGLICLRDGVPIGYAVFFFSYSTWLRSEERSVGKEWVSTCRSRWSTFP